MCYTMLLEDPIQTRPTLDSYEPHVGQYYTVVPFERFFVPKGVQ